MWNYYPKSAPRPTAVSGKERMKFGTTWWGNKWVRSVEDIGDSERMSRGRAYARANRAFDIDIKDGSVTAKVEGSRGNYKVSLLFLKLGKANKDKLLSTLHAQPELLGEVLNNKMPENLEEASQVTLIPSDFESTCSCPDYENPCKHIAAVFYTLAAEIDMAPQILLKIQGVDKNEILNSAMGGAKVIGRQSQSGKIAVKKRPGIGKKTKKAIPLVAKKKSGKAPHPTSK
ncbi:SWIM zinc finger family protein [Candidatus Woesearchaeota archaeon]|nr:SWIM zinc finger family protein [Candidatus Woesearchaeota archaeon]